ncbi:MAG: response regulator [Bacillota bacterium]|nr:response regulator [Bacillota bacterium]
MTNVLVIDTNATTGYRIKKMFDGYPVEVTSVTSGRDALSRLHKGHDIILIDINLGMDDGFDIIQRINEVSVGSLIIIVTSINTRKAFVRGIRLGASDYILKPFEDDYVRAKLLGHIKKFDRGPRGNVDEFIYRHIQRATREHSELLVGLLVVYNKNNPLQNVAKMPIVKGLFARLVNLVKQEQNGDRSFYYRGDAISQGNNGELFVVENGKLSDKEFVIRDFKRISQEILSKSDFQYEIEFLSVPHEVGINDKILGVLTKRIEENIVRRDVII